jgi:hypothetical protein
MLWGKKIQLEKETQAALDPEMGKGETKAMEREVYTPNTYFYIKVLCIYLDTCIYYILCHLFA